MNGCFSSADILLPDFDRVDGEKWAVVACDQYTGEPSYWEEADRKAGAAPSTLRLILPEAFLNESEARVPEIRDCMGSYAETVLRSHKDAMVYLERTLSDGTVRRGLVGKVDLECYDYRKGSVSLIRATEGTVLERIPPRVAVRREALLELPHVMLLIDDPDQKVIEPCAAETGSWSLAYDTPLMLGGGHAKGWFVDGKTEQRVQTALSELATADEMMKKYGRAYEPLLFAVGDGNHSLATAKAVYEEVKAKLGEAAREHPSRYALAEIVNLHDESLVFEPIYRVMFGVSPVAVAAALKEYAEGLAGDGKPQRVEYVHAGGRGSIVFRHPEAELTVGTLQHFIDDYLSSHIGATVDYIHGTEATERLAAEEGAIGFLFDGMNKDQLFKSVMADGALPRKTFSMGHATDKRYYMECRKIQ